MKTLARFVLVFVLGLQLSWGQQQDSLQTKKTFTNWEGLKKKIYSLVEIFEKEFEKNSETKEKSYFG